MSYNLFKYGEDVGTPVPPLLVGEKHNVPTVPAADLAKMTSQLEEDGAVVLKDFLTEAEVDRLRKVFKVKRNVFGQMKGETEFSTRGVPNAIVEEMDQECSVLEPTPGRRHFLLRGTTIEPMVNDVSRGVLPLVQSYMSKAREGTEMRGHKGGEQIFVSEVQLIVQEPLASEQFWHVNNTSKGVTVVVPLTKIPSGQGPEQIFPGSQKLMGEGVLSSLRGIANVSEPVSLPLEVGDALVMDARLMKKGLKNADFTKAPLYLLFRYDFLDCPPPGQRVWTVFCLCGVGRLLRATTSACSALTPWRS